MNNAVDQYWDCVVEKDAAWLSFSKVASKNNWTLYAEAVEAEEQALKVLEASGKTLCHCGAVINQPDTSCEDCWNTTERKNSVHKIP
jgi:hypothetical protein